LDSCSICHWYGPTRRQRALWTVSQERRSRFLAERRLIGDVDVMMSPIDGGDSTTELLLLLLLLLLSLLFLNSHVLKLFEIYKFN